MTSPIFETHTHKFATLAKTEQGRRLRSAPFLVYYERMGDNEPLEKWSTEQLERWLEAGTFNFGDKLRARRILRERETAPDRRLQIAILVIAALTLIVAVLTWIGVAP